MQFELSQISAAINELPKFDDTKFVNLVIKVNPLPDVEPEFIVKVPSGYSINQLLPASLKSEQIICRYAPFNASRMVGGPYILRKDWGVVTQPGDHVEFIVRAGGEDSDPLRIILQIVVLYVAFQTGIYFGGLETFQGALATFAVTTVGNLAINALLPVDQLGSGGLSGPTSNSYNISLQGNAAKLDGAIPVLYGRNPGYFPDFGANPYVEYDENSDQYYYAYLVIGWGSFTNISLFIDDTPLSNFNDIEYNILGVGDEPSIVNPSVVTAPEIANQEITSGRYTPGIIVCQPGLRASSIGIDIVFNGLGAADSDGDWGNKTVELEFFIREVDDAGIALGPWSSLATEDITAASPNVLRRSFKYDLPSPIRAQIRAARLDIKSENQRVLNTPIWTGLRAYLDIDNAGQLGTTRVEIKIRATEQLNSLTQRRIAVNCQRLLRTWHPDTGWSSEVATRSPAWALADKWSNTTYGDGLPDSRIDLQSLYELDQLCTQRQDRCDAIFDTFFDSNTADQAIATTMRAFVVKRNGVRTAVRDQAQDVPTKAFLSRMIRPNSLSIDYSVANSQTPDGIILEYFSNVTKDWEEIECPAPGVVSMARPVRRRLPFVRGITHATREGRFYAGKLVYRRKRVSFATEMQGSVVAYGKSVIVAPALRSYGLSCDAVSWDAGTFELVVSEPVVFEAGATHYITLIDERGNPTDSIEILPGADQYTLILAQAPGITITTDDATRERTVVHISRSTEQRQVMRVVGTTPAGYDESGAPVINIICESDDPILHTLDEDLLPGPGDDQDNEEEPPINDDDDSDSEIILVELPTNINVFHFSRTQTIFDFLITVGFQVRRNGRLQGDDFDGTGYQNIYDTNDGLGGTQGPQYWLRYGAADPSTGALYQARFSVPSGFESYIGGSPLDTWVDLDTDADWTFTFQDGDPYIDTSILSESLIYAVVNGTLRIRDKATNTIQSTTSVRLAAGVKTGDIVG